MIPISISKLFNYKVDSGNCSWTIQDVLGDLWDGPAIEKEVFEMPVITDTDGGRWIPVNEDALRELVNAFKALRVQEEAEKNEPLTLEELREMDGEPVYVVSYNSDETGWRIVDSVVDYRGAVFDSDRVNVFFNDSFLEDGRTINEEWFAYLRKPKEA